jgi:two-component system, OmpR family, sensor kinase
MNRLSIRLRITLAFTIAMALVLAAFGAFLFVQTRSQLDESVHDSLEQRAADVATTVALNEDNGSLLAFQDLDPEDSFAQVIGPDGETEFATDQVGDTPVATEPGVTDLESVDGIDGRARVLVTDIGDGRTAIVGATLEDRDESVKNLALLLAIGGPASLLLAGFGGWWVAGRALDPLEKGYERERRFVDDASHELRTPLALHKAELEVALHYAEDERTLRAAIESGVEEVDRLAQLADDLLVVARSGEGSLALRPEVVDVAGLFATLATRFDARLRAAHRSLAVEAKPGLLVSADRLRLEQALTNLIENAIRHGAGRIQLSAETVGGGTRLHVKDQGAGFDEEFKERAFERFTRGDAARGRGGAGLGLAIVETIAEAHGGSAGTTTGSVPGADVWIELPSVG